jgi:hypothetical protein
LDQIVSVRQKKIARKMSQFIGEVKPKSFIGRTEQGCDPHTPSKRDSLEGTMKRQVLREKRDFS